MTTPATRLLSLPIKQAASSGRLTAPLKWDAAARRFIDADGKTVERTELRQWIQIVLGRSGSYLNDATTKMLEESLSHEDWALLWVRELKNLHTALAVVANGGRAQMDESRWGALGSKLKFELSHFRDNVYYAYERGDVSADQLAAKAETYAGDGWKTYQNTFSTDESEAGHYDREL